MDVMHSLKFGKKRHGLQPVFALAFTSVVKLGVLTLESVMGDSFMEPG